MLQHLRANLWLLIVTLILCSVVYPLTLWAIGQVVFTSQAEGSLIVARGKPIGSRLIAQPFSGDEFFQPRPSAVSYNASASGASNWGPSNYLLRDRVARSLGSIVKYSNDNHRKGPVAPDVLAWFQKHPNLVTIWVEKYPDVARAWVGADPAHAKLVDDWKTKHLDEVDKWQADNAGNAGPTAADLAVPYFKSFAKANPGSWPKGADDPTWSVPAVFFDLWLQAHPNVKLQPVPADLVMASGSGLDPHITLANAIYQMDRVAGAWVKKNHLEKFIVRDLIEKLLREKADSPLAGLAGVPLVNVLEINLDLASRMERLAQTTHGKK